MLSRRKCPSLRRIVLQLCRFDHIHLFVFRVLDLRFGSYLYGSVEAGSEKLGTVKCKLLSVSRAEPQRCFVRPGRNSGHWARKNPSVISTDAVLEGLPVSE